MSDDDIKSLQRDAKRLATSLSTFASMKSSSVTFLSDLRKAANRLPQGTDAATVIDGIREQAIAYSDAESAKRAKAFGALEAAFIRAVREREVPAREYNAAWRVGPLEVQLQRDESRARCVYNHEVVVPWAPVATDGDLMAAYEEGIAVLKASEVQEEDLVAWVTRAFADAVRTTSETPKANGLVPAHDLLRSLRLERIRDELSGANPGKSLRNHEFPLWALLYNLDRYREISAHHATTPRIAFQTGSQQEQSQGKAITLNGLDALRDYQSFTYAIRRG